MKTKNKYTQLVEKIVNAVIKKMPKNQHALINVFAKEFFANFEWNDFKNMEESNLSNLVSSFWQFFYKRKTKSVKLKVFNPVLAKDGWERPGTVIMLVLDDMPFIMRSVQMRLNSLGFHVNLAIGLGGIKTERDRAGLLMKLMPIQSQEKSMLAEGPAYIEIDKRVDAQQINEITNSIEQVINDVKLVIKDFDKMRHKVAEAIEDIETASIKIDKAELLEVEEFLNWLLQDNFIFLGYCKYEATFLKNKYVLRTIPKSNLGLPLAKEKEAIKSYAEMLPKAVKLELSKYPLILSKTNNVSTIYHPVYTDSIVIKCYDDSGKVIGGHRFIGLYASNLYNDNLLHIPLLREKIEKLLNKFGYPRNDYNSRALFHVLETMPRDDLLYGEIDELYDIATGIFKLNGRRVTRLFVYEELYGRYLSCLVYMPRDNFNTDVRRRIQKYLVQAFGGVSSNFNVLFADPILARVHIVIELGERNKNNYDFAAVEREVIKLASSWHDELANCLHEIFTDGNAEKIATDYLRAFPAGYREAFPPCFALQDIAEMEKLGEGINDLGMLFYRLPDADPNTARLKLFHLGSNKKLSDTLPILESMGFNVISEQSYRVKTSSKIIWINDFGLEVKCNLAINIDAIKDLFIETFRKAWYQEVSSDSFNSLTLIAKLNWREIFLLRAYARYMRQMRFPFEQQYLEHVLTTHCDLAKMLVAIFELKFNPELKESARREIERVRSTFNKNLNAIQSLEEDRVLRQFLALIDATVRTNYYQHKEYLSFKFCCRDIPELPSPRPLFEIFSYSPQFEGVHLRMAKVARGGLRWSDRREDFRTEILGLMKAQQVKNVVIVPYGAKGGFVLKKTDPTWTREQLQQEGVCCYKKFISSLLDITDNIVADKLVPPKNVIRYDEPDPYLVVAADKGTATFSNIANGISKDYGFWLYDAFASGGATGYDHKAIGITARGAWESVKYNFYELGIDINKDDFTVVGIGDMAGDVFGNGMLLSKHIKLIGAFNHMHIFLDPNPDPKQSFAERLRLFKMPQLSWADYNPKLISNGGGVFNRSAKSIKVSREVKHLLQIDKDEIAPNELIKHLLRAPVDLLWNGGIGTYVKASTENHADVGDRNNDALRIDATELRCKTIAEGGNLGMTQLGRVEFSLLGGVVNTDFIDNSGGVDCSDHEVNIKILLNQLMQKRKLTEPRRNQLLAKMEDEVSHLVLQNNYRQVRAISLMSQDSVANIDLFRDYLSYQEALGKINRKLEFLPNDKILQERKLQRQGLTRPEVAIVLAYSKLIVKAEILNHDLVNDVYFEKYLQKEFPKLLCDKFKMPMQHHKLRKEIIATHLSNEFVTNLGISFFNEIKGETSCQLMDVICAYVIADEIFDFSTHLKQIEALAFPVTVQLQKQLVLKMRNFILRVIKWLLANIEFDQDVMSIIVQFKEKIILLNKQMRSLLPASNAETIALRVQELAAADVPSELAAYTVTGSFKYSLLNIVKVAIDSHENINNVAKVYFGLQEFLGISSLFKQFEEYSAASAMAAAACAVLKIDVDKKQCALVTQILRYGKMHHISNSEQLLDDWAKKQQVFLSEWNKFMAMLKNGTVVFDTLYMIVHKLLSV